MINARQIVLDLEEKAFEERPELKGHLGEISFRSLARRPGRTILVDRSLDRKFTAGKLLAVAVTLARHWKRALSDKRVGVVFPPGLGAIVSSLALVLCDKVSVNLNFTVGRSALEASIDQAGIETIITTGAVKEKLPGFPWTEHTLDLMAELKALSKLSILGWLMAIWLLPAGWLARWLGIPSDGDGREGGLLFSSGSTGEPKGIVLSHRNILGNCLQISECGVLPQKERLLGCLPIFHSFGFTVTLWYPLIAGLRLVTLPSPLETKRIAQTIREESITVLIGTPTFFRPYFKKAEPADLQSVRFVVAGAEKTPPGFKEKWEKHFGSLYLEGYGLTETSPVVSVNLPDPLLSTKTVSSLPGQRTGSVGRLFLGMAARIVDPETGEEKPLLQTGMLQLRGPNVFSGYLKDPERSKAAFVNGWFVTGDLARFDEDGFLYIEGRLSRFSKVGGEMVPHGTVEQHIVKALGLEESGLPQVAVAGIPDPAKGEVLVLLSTVGITLKTLREKLATSGLPNLWMPKKIKRVKTIPCLASGKLDLKTLRQLVKEK